MSDKICGVLQKYLGVNPSTCKRALRGQPAEGEAGKTAASPTRAYFFYTGPNGQPEGRLPKSFCRNVTETPVSERRLPESKMLNSDKPIKITADRGCRIIQTGETRYISDGKIDEEQKDTPCKGLLMEYFSAKVDANGNNRIDVGEDEGARVYFYRSQDHTRDYGENIVQVVVVPDSPSGEVQHHAATWGTK